MPTRERSEPGVGAEEGPLETADADMEGAPEAPEIPVSAPARKEGDVEREKMAARAGIVGLGTLASRVLGFVRDVVIAALFPREATDAFAVALTIPNALRQLLAEGAVSSAVVPVLSERLAKDGDEAGQAFFAFPGGRFVQFQKQAAGGERPFRAFQQAHFQVCQTEMLKSSRSRDDGRLQPEEEFVALRRREAGIAQADGRRVHGLRFQRGNSQSVVDLRIVTFAYPIDRRNCDGKATALPGLR